MAIISIINRLRLIQVLDQLCFATMIVVFFPHIRSQGSSQLFMGSIMSIQSFVGLIWNPIIGSLGDTYGRKTILTRLLAVCAISHFLLVLSDSLVLIFISRIVAAFAMPILPTVGTTASELLTKEEQSAYYSKFPAFMSFSFIVGSLAGGFISEFNNGYHKAYMIMVVLNLVNIGIASTLPDTTKDKKEAPQSSSIPQMVQRELNNVGNKLTSINWKQYSDIFSIKLCFELACLLFFRSIGPSFEEFGEKGRAIGFVITFMSICTILASLILANLKKTIYAEDKFGNKRLFHAAIMFAITAVILSFSNSALLFSTGFLPLAIARTISDSTFTEALLAKASDKDKGGVSGAFESIVSFCGLVMPLLSGYLSDLYGLKFTIKLSFVPLLVGLFLTYRQT